MAAKLKSGQEPLDVDSVVEPSTPTARDLAMISEAIQKSKAAIARKAQTKKASVCRARVTV